jgi:hypothetical protein
MFAASVFSMPANAANALDGDRFSFSLGMFFTDRDTQTQLDGTTANGTPTDLENDLGLDSSDNVFRVDGYYRFNDKHRFDFSIFDLSRSGSKQIERDIQWGDTLYAIDTDIVADFDLTIYKAAYTYSFMQKEDGYLGATIGVYAADTKVSLSEQNLGQAEIGDITAPLPVIGLRGEYELTDKWSFRASGEFFFIEYNDIDGSLVDLYAGVDYAVRDSMSIGLGINSVDLDVDASKSRFQGSLDWQYTGGLLFLKFDF